VETDDLAVVMAYDEKGDEYSECGLRHSVAVDGVDVDHVIIEGRSPGLRLWRSNSTPVLANGCLEQHVPEHREFGLNARDAPARVCHAQV